MNLGGRTIVNKFGRLQWLHKGDWHNLQNFLLSARALFNFLLSIAMQSVIPSLKIAPLFFFFLYCPGTKNVEPTLMPT